MGDFASVRSHPPALYSAKIFVMQADLEFIDLLRAAGRQDAAAEARIFALVYDELLRIARSQRLRWGAAPTLNTTAVVHEGYLRLSRGALAGVDDRRHFLNLAARVMRSVVVDAARRGATTKRGGDLERTADPEGLEQLPDVQFERSPEELLALDAALDRLGAADGRLARVVEMKFFAGLSDDEAAEALGVTDRTVRRDWRRARAFLLVELQADPAAGAAFA